MPNHIQNKLTISGDENSIGEFKNLMGDKFSLENIIPTPKELLENDSDDNPLTFAEGIKKGLPEWYSWRMVNWGTKWDVDFCEQKGLVYQFVSAWSPPITALINLSKKIPKLIMSLEYDDVMNDAYSSCTITKGAVKLTALKSHGIEKIYAD